MCFAYLVATVETACLLQVVAGCDTNQRPALSPRQFPEVVRALDYFAVPEALWPLAILTQAAVKEAHAKLYKVAQGLLDTVMDQLLELSDLDRERASASFQVCKADDGSLTAKSCYPSDIAAGVLDGPFVQINCALGAAMQHVAQLHHVTLYFYEERQVGQGTFEAKMTIPGLL